MISIYVGEVDVYIKVTFDSRFSVIDVREAVVSYSEDSDDPNANDKET